MQSWRWLYPGMRLKRWFFLIGLAIVVFIVGFSGLMSAHVSGIHLRPVIIVDIEDDLKRLKFIDFLFMLLGVWIFILCIRRLMFSVLTVYAPAREKEFLNVVYEK